MSRRRIDYEDTGPALEAIAGNVYGENWPQLDPGGRARAKQQLLDTFLPGLNVILDGLNERLNDLLADAWDSGYRNGYSIGNRDDPSALTNYRNPYRSEDTP